MRSQIRNLNESRPFYSRPCAAPVPRACCSWGLQLASWLLCALRGSRRHQQPVCCFQVLDDSWDRPSLQEMLMLMRMQRRKILWVFIDLGFFWGDGCLAVTSLKQDVKYFLYSWVLLFVFFFFLHQKCFISAWDSPGSSKARMMLQYKAICSLPWFTSISLIPRLSKLLHGCWLQ